MVNRFEKSIDSKDDLNETIQPTDHGDFLADKIEEGIRRRMKEKADKERGKENGRSKKITTLKEELNNDFKEEPEFQEEDKEVVDAEEGIEDREKGEETVEDRIENVNSFEELVDILKSIKKGFGFSLKNGGFYRGKFGGEPIVQTIRRINEIQRTVMSLDPGWSKRFGDYANNQHISYNLEDVPEEGGLKGKIQELLKKQQIIDEEKERRKEGQEKERINFEKERELEEYYSTLGVSKNSSQEEIQKVYRKLAMKHHPDRNIGDKEAEERFKKIQNAYEVLTSKK